MSSTGCNFPKLAAMPASSNLIAFADDAVRCAPVDVNCKDHWWNGKRARPSDAHVYLALGLVCL